MSFSKKKIAVRLFIRYSKATLRALYLVHYFSQYSSVWQNHLQVQHEFYTPMQKTHILQLTGTTAPCFVPCFPRMDTSGMITKNSSFRHILTSKFLNLTNKSLSPFSFLLGTLFIISLKINIHDLSQPHQTNHKTSVSRGLPQELGVIFFTEREESLRFPEKPSDRFFRRPHINIFQRNRMCYHLVSDVTLTHERKKHWSQICCIFAWSPTSDSCYVGHASLMVDLFNWTLS